MSLGKGGTTQSSTSNTTSPAFLEDPTQSATSSATSLYNAGAPQYYAGQTVAPLNAAQLTAINNITGMANAGSPGVNNANTTLNGILNTPAGTGSPVLQQLMNTAGAQAASAVNGSFNQANRLGSGANAATAATAATNAALPYEQTQYNDNVNQQIAAAQQEPALAQVPYAQQAAAGQAASIPQTQQQAEDTAAQTAYNYNAQEPENFLNNYLQQLYQSPANNTVSNSTNTSSSSGGLLSDLLTGASLLSGAGGLGGIGSALGSVGSGIGSAFSSIAGGYNPLSLSGLESGFSGAEMSSPLASSDFLDELASAGISLG